MQILSRRDAYNQGKKRYFNGKPCLYGHVSERSTGDYKCLICKRISSKRLSPSDRRTKYERSKSGNPESILVARARHRAGSKGLEFSICRDDVYVPENCPCCGIMLARAGAVGKAASNSPSLDRIDNNRGYVSGNVAVICWGCNELKGTASAAELRKTADTFRTIANWIDSAPFAKMEFHIYRKQTSRSDDFIDNSLGILAFGETKSVRGWVKDPRCRVSRFCLRKRIRAGWNPEAALSTIATRGRPSLGRGT
jgi:hypothetical protein